MVGVAMVDRSGRFRAQPLIRALGWRTDDITVAEALPQTIIVRRAAEGRFRIDARGQIFVPAPLRSLFQIGTGDRIVAAAAIDSDLLILHPSDFVADLLASYYASLTREANET